jgi:hypothetical protein
MNRRLVSVCILALAGIAGFSAARTGSNEPTAVSSEWQWHKVERSRGPYTNRTRADNAKARAQEQRKVATAALTCGYLRPCATPFAIPITFEPNMGQFDGRVKFAGRGEGMTLLLTETGIDVAVQHRALRKPRTQMVQIQFGWARSTRERSGRSPEFVWRGEQRIRTISNYFVGNRRAWRTNVPHFDRVIAESRGTERLGMAVYSADRGVEYDLRLAPGENPRKLRLRVSGATSLKLSGGDLLLNAGGRQLRMGKPRIYEQLHGGIRKILRGGYLLEPHGSVRLRVAKHNPRATLVIDPSLSVSYATFLGGAGSETAGNVAIDAGGKVYVSGVTTSATTFPELTAASMGPVLGPSAFYVAKIDPTVSGANSLLYLTFLGGSGTQSGGLIAVDTAGDVALTGTTTSTDFPVTGSSEPTEGLTSGSGNDAVVAEINAAGNELNFSAYFGGSGTLSANGSGGIAFGSVGTVYIASDVQPSAADTSSPDLPVTTSLGSGQPYQSIWDGMGSDGFLAVFAPPAQAGGAPVLTYCTYLGTISAGAVAIGGVAVDSGGDAYIAGSTSNAGNTFPAQNAFQSSYGGGRSDGFVMEIAPQGQGASDLLYATLLGGSGADQILAIALDPPGTLPAGIPPKAYVVGATQSTDFPTRNAYQSALGCVLPEQECPPTNAFLAVIAQDAVSHQTSLAYSSYLGGARSDFAQAVAVATSGSVYVAGQTDSAGFPWHDNLQPFNTGDSTTDADAFLAKFDTTSSGAASLLYSTPLGGTAAPGASASTAASGVATSGLGQVYLTGQTTAADFPTAITSSGTQANGFQQQCTSCQAATPGGDAFLLLISENAAPAPSVYFSAGAVVLGTLPLGGSGVPQAVAVFNGGDPTATLTISRMSFVGPNAGDFTAQVGPGCLDVPIAPAVPGASPACSMEIAFTPSIGGPEQAFLALWDNAPGSPQLLELKGTGGAPHAQVLPAALNFGNQPINTTIWQTATLTNTGTEPLAFKLGSPAAPYQVGSVACPATDNSAVSLQPGNTCTFQIGFTPTVTGTFQGQFTITDNSDSVSTAQQVVTLSGTGVPAEPLAQINPATITFGATVVGATGAPQSVTLQNRGSAALDVGAISITGTNAADFTIARSGTTCPIAGGTVAANEQCTVAVQFAPQSAASSETAVLTFSDNSSTSPQTVALTGTATNPPSLSVSPSNVAFGSQSEGTASAAQLVTITNSGSGAAGISGIVISGSPDFVQSNACPPVLGAGAKCQVSMTFEPAEAAAGGARSAALLVPGGTPSSVALSGIATRSAISLTTSLNFASQLVGTAGAAQPVTITNSSSGAAAGALAFAEISIAGANKADFSISSNQCPGSAGVAPGNSCTVQIVFQPQAAAACGGDPNRSATLQLADNAPGSPQFVPLSGTAADFCLASGNGQPVSTPVQPGQTATFSMEVASAGGFTGAVNLSCSIAPAGAEIGPCAIGTTPASNTPSVQVTPTAAGQFTVSVPTVAPSSGIAFIRPPRLRMPPTLPGNVRTLSVASAWLTCMFWLVSCSWRRNRGGSLPRRPWLIRGIPLAALAVGLALGITACGSAGGGGSDPPSATVLGTPSGTYTITVTASTTSGSNSTSRTAFLTLTVEPPPSN